MKYFLILAIFFLLGVSPPETQAYTFITCPANGSLLNFGSGNMTFNFANNLSTAQKNAISLGHDRLTAFSNSSITTLDNNDNDFYSGNGESEIYLDSEEATASCSYWYIPATCSVVEADMHYGTQAWTTNDNSQHYPYASGRSITGTAIHEGGHCIGMAHSNNLYNMMGAEFSYVTRQGLQAYYGPGEDLSAGLIDLYGKKSGGAETNRDVGITVMRYAGFFGEYSLHDFGVLRTAVGTELPAVGSYVGQPAYQIPAGSTVQMEITLENSGEVDVENPNLGFYLSTNDIISTDDILLAETWAILSRDAPFETIFSVTIPGTTASGNYFLGAYIDHDGLIMETTVANNAAYYPIAVVNLAPEVTIGVATSVTRTAATLNATVNPKGFGTTAHFDYGTTAAYGSTVTYGAIGSGVAPVGVAVPISELSCGTTYHFRARGVSAVGTGLGSDSTFSTSACPLPGC